MLRSDYGFPSWYDLCDETEDEEFYDDESTELDEIDESYDLY